MLTARSDGAVRRREDGSHGSRVIEQKKRKACSGSSRPFVLPVADLSLSSVMLRQVVENDGLFGRRERHAAPDHDLERLRPILPGLTNARDVAKVMAERTFCLYKVRTRPFGELVRLLLSCGRREDDQARREQQRP